MFEEREGREEATSTKRGTMPQSNDLLSRVDKAFGFSGRAVSSEGSRSVGQVRADALKFNKNETDKVRSTPRARGVDQ